MFCPFVVFYSLTTAAMRVYPPNLQRAVVRLKMPASIGRPPCLHRTVYRTSSAYNLLTISAILLVVV